MRLTTLLAISLTLLLTADTGGCAQQVITRESQNRTLADQWNRAKEEAAQFTDGFWIGYSIERLMGRDSHIGHYSGGVMAHQPTLEMILGGETDHQVIYETKNEESVREAAERALRNQNQQVQTGEKVLKKVALLFYFSDNPEDISGATDIKISNLSRYVDLNEKPLIWLGIIEQRESVGFLSGAYPQMPSEEIQEACITSIGLHQVSPDVRNFLGSVVRSDDSDELREAAVFWLSQQEDTEVVGILIMTAQSDRSQGVREKAVFALSQHQSDQAQEALIDLARDAEDTAVREQAVFWLGQSDQPAVVEMLVEFARSDPETDVRKKAVFALSRHDTEEATEALIDLAKNEADTEVRKQAIFWLGQKASELAVQGLKEAAYDEADSDIQEHAVFAISQLKDNAGVPLLIELAREHPNIEVRKKAIFWLGQSNDPRATEAIIDIVKKR